MNLIPREIFKLAPFSPDVLSLLDTAPNISVKDFDASKPIDVSSDAVGEHKIINATAHLKPLSEALKSYKEGQSGLMFEALDSLILSILPQVRRQQSLIALQELVYLEMNTERGAYFPEFHWDANWLQFPGVDGFQLWYLMEENDKEGGNMFMAHTNDLHKDDLPVSYRQTEDGGIVKVINDFDSMAPSKFFSDVSEAGMEFRYLDMHAGDCLIFSKRTLHSSDPRPFIAGFPPKRRALNMRVIIRDKGKETIPVFPGYIWSDILPMNSWLKDRALQQAKQNNQVVKSIINVPVSRFDLLDWIPPW